MEVRRECSCHGEGDLKLEDLTVMCFKERRGRIPGMPGDT